MTTEVIERNDGITVIEIGIPGPQGPPGTLIEVAEDGAVAVTPLRELDFRTGFDITEPTSRRAQIDLDLSEVSAGGELAGTLDAPTVDALHSGSTHQSIADDLNAHEIDVVGAHNAAAIAFTPTDTITAADTQAAVVEALTDARTYTDDGHVILSSRRGAVDGVAGLDSGGTIPGAQIPAAVARDTEVSAADAAHVAAADPHTGYQKESEKGATSGYASLDSAGKVPTAQIPAVAFGSVFVVASQAEMLALAANPGDIAVRSDVSQTFILTALPASTLGNWVELLSGAGGVTSVDGLTGAVTGVELSANKGAASGYAALDGAGTVPDSQISSTIARDTEYTAADAAHAAGADPHTGYQKESEKGSISGYAALDGSGYVPDAQLNPTIARDTEVSDAVTAHNAAADPHTGYQKESEKAAASGYASLDAGTKVPIAQVPTGTTSSTVALGDAPAAALSTAEAYTDTHVADVSAAHAASAVAFTPGGTVAATDVQAAVEEVATEYVAADSTHLAADAGTGGKLHINVSEAPPHRFVSTTGSDSTGDGRWDRPFATYAAALTAVGAGAGTVEFKGGHYSISAALVINRNGFTLMGQGKDDTFLDFTGTGVGIEVGNGGGIYRGTIAGLRLVDTGGNGTIGVNMHFAREYTVHDIDVRSPSASPQTGWSDAGVVVNGTSSAAGSWNTRFHRVTVAQCQGHGFRTSYATNGCSFTDGYSSQNGGDGFRIGDGCAVLIQGCEVEGNGKLNESTSAAIRFRQEAVGSHLGGNTIIGNYFEAVGHDAGSRIIVIDETGGIATGLDGLNIIGNYLFGGASGALIGSDYAIESNTPLGFCRGEVRGNYIHGVGVGGVKLVTANDRLMVSGVRPLSLFYTGTSLPLVDDAAGVAGGGLAGLINNRELAYGVDLAVRKVAGDSQPTVRINRAASTGLTLGPGGSTVTDVGYGRGGANIAKVTATGGLQIPSATSPAQTADATMVWDSDDDHLTVGTGSGRKTLANSDDTLPAAVTFLSVEKWTAF